MNLEQVKEFLANNSESEDVKEYLESFKQDADVNLDIIKSKIESDEDVKSFIDSIKDKHSSKALETWKTNHLEGLINEEIRQRFPEKDEKDIKLQELSNKIEAMEREKTQERLKNVALKAATNKGLPVDLVDYFIGANEEMTLENLGKLEDVFNSHLETSVKERLKDTSYAPPKSGSKNEYTTEDFGKMSPEEINEFFEGKE